MVDRPHIRRGILLALALAIGLAACEQPRVTDHTVQPAARSATAARRDAGPRKPAAPDRPLTSGESHVPAMPARGRWSVQEREPPRAVWGAPDSEAVLSFACDGEAGRIRLEREAIAIGEDVRLLTIEADGTRVDYPVERLQNTLGPYLATAIALDAAILDRLLGARSMAVVAGSERLAVAAPGAALKAVVDACRGAY
jgi:hypothetical protein